MCEQLKPSTWLAVDTEFERVSSYYPELCLVQVSNGEITAVIDPITINDISPLLDLFYNPKITIVLHSAHQDLEIFFNIKRSVPIPLFDTQLAAPLLGYTQGIGYGNLVNEALEIELEKGHARADWKKRPISDEMLKYAADDVIYLAALYKLFIEKLKDVDDLSDMNERVDRLAKSETYEPDPGLLWKKIFAAKKMRGKPLETLKRLAAWREITARKRNRPRKWILPDHALVEMAKQSPENKTELITIDKVSEKIVNRHGDELLTIFKEVNS